VEKLKMSLEIEKRKIEDDLKAERALALDKDELLARSKKRESELEDEIVALQTDIDNLDSQLDRALKLQKASEEKYESLRAAFDEAAGHLVRLEGEQRERGLRDVEISDRLEDIDKECVVLRQERNELQRSSEELQSLVSRLEQDLIRAKEHMDIATADLEGRLDVEQRNRLISLASSQIV
jgi:myosin protein heavy chain